MTQQLASPVKKADRRSRRADFLMTERTVAPRLADIIDAIERIRCVLDGVTLEDFEQNWKKRWLVKRGVEITSEASRHLTDDMKNSDGHASDHVAPNVL